MKKRFYILNNLYLDGEGEKLSIGGVETYIYNLCKVIMDLGYVPEVYQHSNIPFSREYEGVAVHGISVDKKQFVKHVLKAIPEHEVVIFANDEVVYGRYTGTVINLQHGVGWDYQRHKYRGELAEKCYKLFSDRDNRRRIKYSKLADYVVCVDYNYVNWFRTQVNCVKTKFNIIPNFTETFENIPIKPMERINVIFARRFVEYRGTRIFTKAVKKLIDEYPMLHVTYAGSGPDREWIKEQLRDKPNVHFMSYRSTESLSVHADMHIAVVPSVGSEGTSLSLLEAMAAGCAVVCTDVGGMTNIVLDHYNGLMVEPNCEAIYTAIKELIQNATLRNELSKRGFDTAIHAFSKKRWIDEWNALLAEIVS